LSVDASWTFAPIVLLALAGYLGVYVARWRTSRREGGSRAASGWRLAAWCGGVLTLFVALISPVDRLGEQLASVHMVQHLLIADIAAILLTLGLTRHILRPATRRIHRIERAAGPFASPWFGVVAYVGAMWFWHVPALYDAALEHGFVHTLEHLSFGAAGLLYWWHLLSPIRSRLRLEGLAPVAYMASTKILVGLLGIVLAFAPDLIYDSYDHGGKLWGMTAEDDQRVAGLIMALEQSIVMGIAVAWLFVRMLSESERQEQRAERYPETGRGASP
jgi:putative membrane protein